MNGLFFIDGPVDLFQFYNKSTLNIFCDASIMGNKNNYTGCYGVVAVNKDNVLDSVYRLVSDTTNNESELKGLRAAISMANKWRNDFAYINIFCDSQISIFGLRDYIYRWKYKDGILYGTANNPIVNQKIFIECHYMLMDTGLQEQVKLFHQSGHVDNGYNNIKNAAMVFKKSNNVRGYVDLNLIRYISTYNNYVDHNSRSHLRRSDRSLKYIDPVYFNLRAPIKRF